MDSLCKKTFSIACSAYVTLSATVTGTDKYSVDKGCFFTYRLTNSYNVLRMNADECVKEKGMCKEMNGASKSLYI